MLTCSYGLLPVKLYYANWVFYLESRIWLRILSSLFHSLEISSALHICLHYHNSIFFK
jgi:hypothetical protein